LVGQVTRPAGICGPSACRGCLWGLSRCGLDYGTRPRRFRMSWAVAPVRVSGRIVGCHPAEIDVGRGRGPGMRACGGRFAAGFARGYWSNGPCRFRGSGGSEGDARDDGLEGGADIPRHHPLPDLLVLAPRPEGRHCFLIAVSWMVATAIGLEPLRLPQAGAGTLVQSGRVVLGIVIFFRSKTTWVGTSVRSATCGPAHNMDDHRSLTTVH